MLISMIKREPAQNAQSFFYRVYVLSINDTNAKFTPNDLDLLYPGKNMKF